MRAAISTIDPRGYNMKQGRWGTCINGQTYQQEAIVSHRGWQYAAWFGEAGALCVGRRRLPDGAWQVLRFADYAIAHEDTHNCAAIGISRDGVVHLAFDHHCDPLHYRCSRPGLASEPERHAWTADAFGPVRDHLEAGRPLTGFTYPMFFAAPDGDLQIVYRLGWSGDGDWFLATYDADRGGWSAPGQIFTRHGAYADSRSRCAYPNPMRYGPDGRLHLTWTWRERPADGMTDLRTNHDLGYAWSPDRGRTWHRDDGAVVLAPGGAAIAVGTPGCTVRAARYRWGRMNTTCQAIDAAGRVHVIDWQHDQDAGGDSLDLNTWRYYHHCRGGDGAWTTRVLPFQGRKPQLLVDRAGTAHVLCAQSEDRNYHGGDPGGQLVLRSASEASGWSDWRTRWTSEARFVGEPQVDQERWRDGVISVYAQERPATPGEPSPLRSIDLLPD